MEEFLDACRELRPKALEEEGCLGYEYTAEVQSTLGAQEPDDINRVILIEKWESLHALSAHGTQPHTKEFGQKVSHVREKVTIRVTEPIALWNRSGCLDENRTHRPPGDRRRPRKSSRGAERV